ncbi:MAG: MBL fold metallo-hydrolase [Acidobacteria bacterium]|nr:MBL fold metallo-hydrolase [Acidobacteriota bacterium]
MRGLSNLTRRSFLQGASLAGASLALREFWPVPAMAESLLQDPRISANPIVDKGFASTRKIGEGIYATIADASKGFQVLSNGGFIVGKDSALLIEGHNLPAGAAYELETLRTVSQVPVTGALNTHYHFDHTFGNSYYGSQGIPVWAHPKTATMMVEKYGRLQGHLDNILTPFQKALAEAKDETAKSHAQGDLNAMQVLSNGIKSSVLSLPNVPLTQLARGPFLVDLGGMKLSIEAHPGHTPTDVMIRIPDQNITFTGDLLFNGSYPVAFDSLPSRWLKALGILASFGKDALFVPGHGAICGQEPIANEKAILEDLGAHAKKMFDAGVSATEASQRYVQPEKFAKFGFFSWAFCIGGAIEHFYEEFKTKKN